VEHLILQGKSRKLLEEPLELELLELECRWKPPELQTRTLELLELEPEH
jgi:hypothetical protein